MPSNGTRYLILAFYFTNICIASSHAQSQADNWYFGNKAALNFSTCTPTVVNGSQLNTVEGCATISDAGGNLLFYTDGINVWNKTNLLMQNGTGLFGHPSSTQSGVIIPQPGNDSIYYVFTIDTEGGSKGLCYSVVNINHNGGLGELIIKNVSILTSANEKLAAARHFNNTDIWVITRQFNSDKYFAWLVTNTGVSTTPVISTSPNYLGSPLGTSRGYLKTSSDGKKIACGLEVFSFFEISDFNNLTGVVSNTIKLSSHPSTIKMQGAAGSYGVEFSPNNRLLYISTRVDIICGMCQNYNYYINQYNVSVFDSTSISNSVILIDSGGSVINPAYYLYGALQLARNGKIYVAQFDVNTLSVINDPDAIGLGCNFQVDAVNLGSGNSKLGLPTFIQSYFDPNYRIYDYSYSEDCSKNVSFTLNTGFVYDSLRWNFDDPASGGNNSSGNPNPTHSYPSNGIRNVQLFVFNQYGCISKTDTITKQIIVGNKYFYLGKDTAVCEKDSLLLNASVTGANSYSWNTGATTPSIKVDQPGIYWCDVSFGGCIYHDSLLLSNKPYPLVNLGIDTTICEGNTLALNAASSNSTYLWQDGSSLPIYIVTKTGKYNVRVNMDGCITSDTISINYRLKPAFTLGNDTKLCLGNSLVLKPVITNGVTSSGLNYLWQDGSTSQTFAVTQQGIYKLEMSNRCGTNSDEVNVTQGICELYVPNAFSPDGKNYIFKTEYGDNITQFYMQVYNRYGQLVFESIDRSKGWDGSFKGYRQPQGTYAWMIRYKTSADRNWQNLQGTVILLR